MALRQRASGDPRPPHRRCRTTPAFRVWGLGFEVSGFGFKVWGLGFGIGVWGLGSRVWGFGIRDLSFGFRVSGVRFRNPEKQRLISCFTGINRCRANVEHTRQSRPDSSLDFRLKVLATCQVVPSSLGGGGHTLQGYLAH